MNLTPHDLVVFDGNQEVLRVPLSHQLLRLAELARGRERVTAMGAEFDIVDLEYGAPDSLLPAEENGVFYVVSRIAANSMRSRRDVLFPMDEVRNAAGAIIGCRRFARLVN